MKVLNLRCGNDHRFEGWFASDDDFVSQGERGLMACPICSDQAITRLPSAPRVNLLGRGDDARPAPSVDAVLPAQPERQQAQWLRAVREMLARTEDVGERFVEEARRIHYGEAEERGIYGEASDEQAQGLNEEGIAVARIPWVPRNDS